MNFYKNILIALLFFTLILGIAFLYIQTQMFYIKYFPVAINFIIFLLFFISLFYEKNVIDYFFVHTYQNDMFPVTFTKNLTYLWGLFWFVNFIISLATTIMSIKAWVLYNCFISFVIIGFLMIVEKTIVHIFYNNKNNEN